MRKRWRVLVSILCGTGIVTFIGTSDGTYLPFFLQPEITERTTFILFGSVFLLLTTVFSLMIWLFLTDCGSRKEGLTVPQAVLALAVGGVLLYAGGALMGVKEAIMGGTVHNLSEAFELSKEMFFGFVSRKQFGYVSFFWIIYSAIFSHWFFGEKRPLGSK